MNVMKVYALKIFYIAQQFWTENTCISSKKMIVLDKEKPKQKRCLVAAF